MPKLFLRSTAHISTIVSAGQISPWVNPAIVYLCYQPGLSYHIVHYVHLVRHSRLIRRSVLIKFTQCFDRTSHLKMASDPALVSTIAVTTYDGIFKNMYDEKIRDMFTDIRVNISKGNWEKADYILMQALKE